MAELTDAQEDALAAFWTIVEPVAGQLPKPVQSALQRGLDAAVEAVATRVRAQEAERLDAYAEDFISGADAGVYAFPDANRQLAMALRWAAGVVRCPRCPIGVCSEHRSPQTHARPAAGTDQPRCPKCQTPLAACDCGQPAQCGELTCAACTPDQLQERTEETP